MKQRVYLETSIVSYLVARPSRDLVVAAHQQLTREWWQKRRRDFDLFVSEAVVREAAAGDPQVAALRLGEISTLSRLAFNEQALRSRDHSDRAACPAAEIR